MLSLTSLGGAGTVTGSKHLVEAVLYHSWKLKQARRLGLTPIHPDSPMAIHGQWTPIQAEVVDLPMLSAHAHADEIMRWLSGFEAAPRKVFMVHGEPSASEAPRVRIGRELGWDATVPRRDQVHTL